jgi:hypothetical protein
VVERAYREERGARAAFASVARPTSGVLVVMVYDSFLEPESCTM